MNFLEYAIEKRALIESTLKEYLSEKKDDLPSIFVDQNILGNIEEYILRGKLLRGTLFIFTNEMLGKKIDKEILKVAVAIEIAHSSFLIHDDFIDNDEIRRGKASFHSLYSLRSLDKGVIDSKHYGESMAIVGGDVGFFLAVDLISSCKQIPTQIVLNYYANELLVVGLAEAVDSEFGQTPNEVLEKDIYEVYRLKTARYTFSMPMVMAALVCNSDNTTIKLLEEFGEKAGVVFQIKDDEIGLFGDAKSIGKPVGSDVRENKKTLIRAMLFKIVNPKERKEISKLFGKSDLSNDELLYVLSVCEKYKIRVKIVNEMNKIMTQVWAIFETLDINKKYRKMLKEFLEFNVSRVS